ncbi:MAG: DUF4832 domain-containing protein [Gemmatimonadetes bacterium]|nr:DUF4832 domain-containing protein [Gemmatimonadota bacterium]
MGKPSVGRPAASGDPLRRQRLGVVMALVMAIGCTNGPSELEVTATLTLAVDVSSLAVEQGGSAELIGTATVNGSFFGSPEVEVMGVPEGVTATVAPPTTNGNTTTVLVTIAVGASVLPGSYPVTLRASGAGVSDEVGLDLVVLAAPEYVLNVAPDMLSVEQGTSGTTEVTLTRVNFTESVSLTAEGGPSGMAVTFDPATMDEDVSQVTVIVEGSVTAGEYEVTIRGEAPELEDRTATLRVAVTAATEEAYSLSVTPNQLLLDPAQPAPGEAASSGPMMASVGQTTVEIQRSNGHAETVSLDLIGQPEGVTTTFEPSSVSGDASALTVSVGPMVAPGEYETSVRGRDGVLVERVTRLLLIIAPTPTYQLLPDPSELVIQQGASGSTGVAVSRVNFTAGVTLSLEGAPSGMTASFADNPAAGDASTLTLDVGVSVAPGTYDLVIRGTTPDLVDRTATIMVTVTAEEGFSLEATPEITVQQGSTESRPVSIVRTGGFTGEVAIGVTPVVTDLTMAVEPSSTAGSATMLTATAAATLAPGTYSFEVTGTAAGEPMSSTTLDVTVTPPPGEVTVRPATIDDVLYNPGMGFIDSHFAYGYQYPEGTFVSYDDFLNPPPYPDPADYPPATVSYFRWCWAEVHPFEDQIDFERFDAILANGAVRSEGERFGFRIISVDDDPDCLPDWLLSKPGYVGYDGHRRHVPDYSNPVFLAALQQLYGALGARYDGHPGMDHIDLGIVGCWGEWNSACLRDRPPLCSVLGQSDAECLATFEHVIDIMMDAFPNTPKIMLGKGSGVMGAAMDYALQRGAGWRVDCFGDWGIFGPDWSHHTNVYPGVVSRVGDAWKRGPVHMEVCFTMPHMYFAHDMSVELVQESFDWALDNHISVFNGKSTPIPDPYWPIVEDFLKRAGYRLVIESLTHPGTASPGEEVVIETTWKNLGVAPPYLPHEVSFRLRDSNGEVAVQEVSGADILDWLPGDHLEMDTLTLPAGLVPGDYFLDVGILSLGSPKPAIDLAIEGGRSDGWYELSVIQVG